MKIRWNHIEWGPRYFPDQEEPRAYEFWWFNWLGWRYKYFGLKIMWYDGPHPSFGFGLFNWNWQTKWDMDLYQWVNRKKHAIQVEVSFHKLSQ